MGGVDAELCRLLIMCGDVHVLDDLDDGRFVQVEVAADVGRLDVALVDVHGPGDVT